MASRPWVRKLFARTTRPARCRPQLEALEDRLTPAYPAFTPLTGAANPFNGLAVGSVGVENDSAPALGDVDGDGRLDVVVGDADGTLVYFKNTGSATHPAYVEQTGSANPFDGIDVGDYSIPALGDVDGDGKLDLVVGEADGTLRYFRNTGTAGSPAYVEQTGAANPFGGIHVDFYSSPALGDVNGDGTLDLVVGNLDGTVQYFQNTGTKTTPAYVEQTGSANPFAGIDIGSYSAPALGDVDGDGRLDLVVGEADGTLQFFRNTGTAGSPAYTQQTGAANPFDGINLGVYPTPALGDVDGDGDLDLVEGHYDGTLAYLRNDSAVVAGTAGDDTLVVGRTPGGAPGDVTYTLNGGPPVSLHGVTSFTFAAGAGNDSLTVNLADGGPLVRGGAVTFAGGDGVDALTLDAAGLPVGVVPGTFSAAGQAVSFTNVESTHVEDAASANTFAGPDTADRPTALAGLDAAHSFVQALYLDALGRPGSKAELDGWVGMLDAPGGSRAQVAGAIERSPEARAHLVQSWYVAFLGRPAQGGEEHGWVGALLAGAAEEEVLAGLLSSTEFYGRAQSLAGGGTADERFVQALYQALLGREGSPAEVAGWAAALPGVGAAGVAGGLLRSLEYRADLAESCYAVLLHRPSEPGQGGWAASNLDATGMRVGFESSDEFLANG